MRKQPTRTAMTTAISGTLALFMGGAAIAGPLNDVGNTFSSGQAATAASVNANFDAVESAVTDNDGRITTNASTISTNAGNLSTHEADTGAHHSRYTDAEAQAANATDINANTTAIGDNATAIGVNGSAISGNSSTISGHTTSIANHETRITTLEGASPGGGSSESSADNSLVSVDCSSQSLQAAIEAAPLHGQTLITISGACSDDIFIRRNNITIQGLTGPGSDSITGNLTGFSSDMAADSYNFVGVGGAGLVQRTLDAALELDGNADIELLDITINAGSNASGISAARHSSLKLKNVVINGGQNGYGVHVSNSNVTFDSATVTGNGVGVASVFAGSAVFAERLSVVELQDNNLFTSGDGSDESSALGALSSSVHLVGSNNSLMAGAGTPDEPTALSILVNSDFLQTVPGTNNLIQGFMEVSSSELYLTNATINATDMGIYDGASFILQPEIAGDIIFNVTGWLDMGFGASMDLGDGNAPVTVNSAGVAGTLNMTSGSNLSLYIGSRLNMDVLMFGNTSIQSEDNAKIGGNLQIAAFSVYLAQQQDDLGSVEGTVFCSNAEATDDRISNGYNNICPVPGP